MDVPTEKPVFRLRGRIWVTHPRVQVWASFTDHGNVGMCRGRGSAPFETWFNARLSSFLEDSGRQQQAQNSRVDYRL
jgi:hypothetical protein